MFISILANLVLAKNAIIDPSNISINEPSNISINEPSADSISDPPSNPLNPSDPLNNPIETQAVEPNNSSSASTVEPNTSATDSASTGNAAYTMMGHSSGSAANTIMGHTSKPNFIPNLPMKINGVTINTGVTMDSDWRNTLLKNTNKSCITSGAWDKTYCKTAETCMKNCEIDGLSQEEYQLLYGVTTKDDSITLKFDNKFPNGLKGSRLTLMDPSKKGYMDFQLLNKELVFTIDNSQVDCGFNGALYLVAMDVKNPLASYGMGYCP